MRAADGHLQLIDLVGLTGEPMTELICTDIDAFFDIIPREECRYLLDIRTSAGTRILRNETALSPPSGRRDRSGESRPPEQRDGSERLTAEPIVAPAIG